MLVAKLDYLQLIAIKGSLSYLGRRTSKLWKAIKNSFDNSTAGEVKTSSLDSRCAIACYITTPVSLA